MKIGILTLPLHTNYGGILQAYALQTVLKRMGHQVVIINKWHKLQKQPAFSVYCKRIIKRILLRKEVAIFPEYHHNRRYKIMSQYTQLFIDKYINSLYVDRLEEISPNTFDAIVVGSDQIWRPKEAGCWGGIENAFLLFAKDWNIHRIAYAPSFGVDAWEFSVKQSNTCKSLIRLFEGVSVREESGIQLCKEHLEHEAVPLLDPTMLLEKNDYIKLANDTPQSPGNLLVYIIDSNKEKQVIIEKVESFLSLKKFEVNSRAEDQSGQSFTLSDMIQPPVESWLRGFSDAKFVVTDSFHACVFSIIFHKPFIVIGNKKRGLARFSSLLSKFGLEDRIIYQKEDLNENLLSQNINFEKISVITDYKKRSYSYLKQWF